MMRGRSQAARPAAPGGDVAVPDRGGSSHGVATTSRVPSTAGGSTAAGRGWSPASFVAEVFRRDRVLAYTGAWMLVQAGIVAALIPFDSRTILGIDPWIKPFKFSVSVAIFLWTLAWLLPSLRIAARLRRALSWCFSAIMLLELACVIGQSARGVRSHFNFETALDAGIFSAMGTAIGVNTLLLALVAVLFFTRAEELPRAYLWGVRLGLLVTLLGSAQGGLIVAHRQHAVGVEDGGPGLPLVNWSTEGGDLRIAHMIGLHAMQVMPLFAFLLGRTRPGWPERRRVATVAGFAVIYVAVAGALLWQALAGAPLVPLT